MKKPEKAYKNPEFMMSPEARTVRMLCEYLEPAMRFDREKVDQAIIFFGSARLRPTPDKSTRGQAPVSGPDYCALATELAAKLAAWTVREHPAGRRYHFCTGGGPGIMEATATGVGRVDRSLNIALNISLPFEQSVNDHVNPDLTFEFHYFFMRKLWFMQLAAAMIVFPGGYGTFDEMFEMLTLVQTGKAQPMPFVLFGREFWDEVIDFKALARRGLIGAEDLERIKFADSVDEAFAHVSESLSASSP